jgi:hypothetical protein
MIGAGEESLYTPEDMRRIREHLEEIRARIRRRAAEIERLSATPVVSEDGAAEPVLRAEAATEGRVEEIRRSVTDEAVRESMEAGGPQGGTPNVHGPGEWGGEAR